MAPSRTRGARVIGSSSPDLEGATSIPPVHIEETIQSIARLHAEHHANSTSHQRIVGNVTALLGRPTFLLALTALIAGWVTLNCLGGLLGFRPPDPPPFQMLTGFASLASLYFVLLILTTERRADRLTQRRELLNMEL